MQVVLLYLSIMTVVALLAYLRRASTNRCEVNKTKISLNVVMIFHFLLMYIILLNKLRFDHISCSERRGTH